MTDTTAVHNIPITNHDIENNANATVSLSLTRKNVPGLSSVTSRMSPIANSPSTPRSNDALTLGRKNAVEAMNVAAWQSCILT